MEIEIDANKNYLIAVSKNNVDENNSQGVMEGNTKIKKLEEAIDMNEFGDLNMRAHMELLLRESELFNNYLSNIKDDVQGGNNHNRIDHWNSAKRKATDLLSDSNKIGYIKFQERLKTYLGSLEGELQDINKQIVLNAKN